MNLDSSPSHFPMHQISHDNDHELQYHHHPFVPNRSSSLSCHFFFDPTQDHARFYDHRQLYQPSHHHIADEKYGYRGGSSYEMKNKVDSGLKLTLWKKGERDELQSHDNNPMKWMSSKMRVMQKMKKTDHDHSFSLKTNDQKLQPSSSSAETDLSSNSSSYNNNSPIRVCSDCNTTKTPLWRSGPKGPKSLCNACGIRQRKARRAMAATTANGAAASTSDQPSVTTKIKLQQKVKTTGKNGHASQLKKRCKTAAAAATAAAAEEGKKQIGFEDFLINLSKNLAFHRVFPEEEKDAAILLMALSSGIVSG